METEKIIRCQPIVFWGDCSNSGDNMFQSLKAGANSAWSNNKTKIPKLNRKKIEMLETSLIKREIVDNEVGEIAMGQVT